MAEQHASHIDRWVTALSQEAMAEIAARLQEAASTGGLTKGFALANGAIAGAAKYLGDTRGTTFVVGLLEAYRRTAAECDALERLPAASEVRS